ncbi:UNVERIFIED_CONTAM: hypothetical protein GTU68_062402, partial [Idotea baltica]|nr:hypothetical protein [Idotea baltica]
MRLKIKYAYVILSSAEKIKELDLQNKTRNEQITLLQEKHKFCSQCASILHIEYYDGEQRLTCSNQGCDYVLWNNPIPVIAVLVEHVNANKQQGAFILAHNVLWPEGKYSVITGFMEAEDLSPQDAARREVKEELNLVAVNYHFIGHYTSSRANQLIIAYYVSAEGSIQLNEELDDYKYISAEKLKGWGTETG